MVDEKLPSGLSDSRAHVPRSLFHLGVLLLIALALWLGVLDLFQPLPSEQVASPTAIATAPPPISVSVSTLPHPTILVPTPTYAIDREASIPPSPPAATPQAENPVPSPVVHLDDADAGRPRPHEGAAEDAQQERQMQASATPVQVEEAASEGETASAPDLPNGGDATPVEVSPSDDHVEPGQDLDLAGQVEPFDSPLLRPQIELNVARAASNWVWPVGGYISQGYAEAHKALDISAEHGDVVVAADAGVVIYAKWEISGYGYLVVVDHGNGFVTYYAHLYGFYVDTGQAVERGQPIGELGDTGHSSGPHLHFEIRQNGFPLDPVTLLPAS